MKHASTKRTILKMIVLAAIVAVAAAIIIHDRGHDTKPTVSQIIPPPASQSKQSVQQPAAFNKSAHSLTDPSSIWVVVNKMHPLQPQTYVPPLSVPNVALKGKASADNMHVATIMAPHLEELFAAAAADGYHLMLSSGYRSYSYQVSVYGRIVNSQGQTSADEQSARPGYSEHQTGLAADVAPLSGKCDLSQCFGQTPEGQWLAANAYRYGFIIRYPADKVSVTGYEYEPWHIRYVGTELSTELHNKGIETLEEFFDVSGGTTYN